jgi:hypothetical protein
LPCDSRPIELSSADLPRPVYTAHSRTALISGLLVLLALAVLIVLTNTVALVITLAILGTIVFLLARRGLAEAGRTNSGR